jgi:23S rRNA (uracil1939-C5)-methyltransferase
MARAQAGPDPEWLRVDSLDLEGQGVATRADGKVVFIEGALPGECVQVVVHRRKARFEQASVVAVQRPATARVTPGCPHFGLHPGACGGCKMQHLQADTQVAVKQRGLEDQLWHLAKVKPWQFLRPIHGPTWGYRYRARLSVRYVPKKDAVLVGFHERKSRYVADITQCPVLLPAVGAMLPALRDAIYRMPSRALCPQIELAADDRTTALVLRHLEPLQAQDLAELKAFASAQQQQGHRVQWWLQPGGPVTVAPLESNQDDGLAYALPTYGLHMPFRPTDFTQVNPAVNRVLVPRALSWLALQPHETAIDWFCGLGNFTLPLATVGARVIGLEGSAALVQRAQHNAAAAGATLRAKPEFVARDLFTLQAADLVALGTAHKWLIDPPREGAFALIKALVDAAEASGQTDGQPDWQPPERIVYVSCNPATLARDAGLLVHRAGMVCEAAGVINMFPHTAHVECMAVFGRGGQADAAPSQAAG